jgi:predicted nuclease of predicted toxin-antitoxin system
MRILLDECLPSDLARELKGHVVRTVTQAGWSGIENGELLRLASRDYEVFLTIDQRLSREQQIPATLAVITLEAPTNRIESLRPLIPALNRALTSVTPGQSLRVSA